jgi:3-oxoacyl-[acyl-carrier-protein] synthase II
VITIEKIMISGIGVVSPIGINRDDFYENLLNEKAIREIEKTAYSGHGDDKKTSRLSGDLKKEIDMSIENSAELPQTFKFGLYAAKTALQDAGLTPDFLAKKRVSVIIGNNDSESEIFDYHIQNGNWNKKHYATYNIAYKISEYFKFNGLAFCVHNTCASSNMALELALSILSKGQSDIVIAGGADSFSLKNYTGFNSLMAISKTGCRPFSKQRDGITVAEGAGILVLERESDLVARNKEVYCEVLGVGSSNDAYHLTKPNEQGITLAINKAFNNAGVTYKDIDYIMAHGTGTQTNDKTESSIINRILPDGKLKGVCSIKGTLGHMMGAAGALGLVAICMIYKNGIIPPSSKSIPLDEECNINIITEKIWDDDIGIFMNNSFGFGGNNSVAILKSIKKR